jgi:predicted transcriptional regulator of viral defense system
MSESSKSSEVIELVKQMGILRPRDLDSHSIPREYLRRLTEKGLLEKIGRGLYSLPGADVSELHRLAEAAKRVPRGVVCLLSALRFHDLTTQNPFQVWVAIDVDAHAPKPDGVPLRIVRFSGAALSSFIEEHDIEGVAVRVYSPAKTVADCFKYRNKIGLNVAIEALQDCWRQRKATMDDIWAAAKVCRVTSVIRPYLESLA